MLEKVKKESVPDKVFELLKREILNGTYKLGDRLPTEMELCKILGVSRVSVKTALQKLCIIGIAEQRVGDGTYVTNLDPRAFISQVQDFMLKDMPDEDLRYYRTHHDILSLLMAMHNITPEDYAELEELAEAMHDVPLEDETRFNYLDYTFHYKMCQMAKNKIHSQIFLEWEPLIYANVQENNRLRRTTEENRAWTYELHKRMLDVIRTKDLTKCMEIYRDLYRISLGGDDDWDNTVESQMAAEAAGKAEKMTV